MSEGASAGAWGRGLYGATSDRNGLIRIADGVTLFLDEISNLRLDLEATLRRAIETQEVRAVGASTPVKGYEDGWCGRARRGVIHGRVGVLGEGRWCLPESGYGEWLAVNGKRRVAAAGGGKRGGRPLFSRTGLGVVGTLVSVIVLVVAVGYPIMVWMPGKSWRGALPPLNEAERGFRVMLEADLNALAGDIGERHVYAFRNMNRAVGYIEEAFKAAGYGVRRIPFEADGKSVCNVEATKAGAGKAGEVVVVGAHYDTVAGAPGADDNGSAVAALLALARAFSGRRAARSVRFVAFANEEPPYFQTDAMGSLVYARACREKGDRIVCMMCLESLGYYSEEKGSQRYPVPVLGLLYPTRGDFIGFVGDISSRKVLKRAIGSFRAHARIPSEGAALPRFTPGVDLSDHWAFWQAGYPAFMVTNTAMFRNPNYHLPSDTVETIDLDRLARVTAGLAAAVDELAGVGR